MSTVYPISGSPWVGSNPNPAYSGIFIPQIWSGKLVEKFYAATVLAGSGGSPGRSRGRLLSRPTLLPPL